MTTMFVLLQCLRFFLCDVFELSFSLSDRLLSAFILVTKCLMTCFIFFLACEFNVRDANKSLTSLVVEGNRVTLLAGYSTLFARFRV